MQDDQPRLSPIPIADLSAEVQEAIRDWPLHLHRCLAHSPQTLTRWMTFAVHILRENTLPIRDREIAVLRIAWIRQSEYEWVRHGRIARNAGLSEADILAVTKGAADPAWAAHEAALITAVDELVSANDISQPVWQVLAGRYAEDQLVDLVMLVGEFMLVAMAIGALHIPLDDDVLHIPRLSAYR